tara:strand:- start:1960 stop:2490 length:531 start_codon:yes stop_codon:yes gene_type:complete
MKKIVLLLLRSCNRLFYPSFNCPDDLIVATFKNIFIQKILGFNRKAFWPVHFTSKVIAPQNIKIGSRAPGLSISCYLDGRNGIQLGKNVWIGPRVTLVSKNHSVTNFNEYIDDSPITIGNNCWLAANVTILPGVQLANHIIVAAGSVVTKSFDEENILIGGTPARKIKSIMSYENR